MIYIEVAILIAYVSYTIYAYKCYPEKLLICGLGALLTLGFIVPQYVENLPNIDLKTRIYFSWFYSCILVIFYFYDRATSLTYVSLKMTREGTARFIRYFSFLALTLGWMFFFLIYSRDVREYGTQWTGTVTIYFMFQKLRWLGLIGLLVIRNRSERLSRLTNVILIVTVLFAIVRWRREEIFLIILLLMYFRVGVFNRRPNFLVVLAFSIVGFVAVKLTHDIRAIMNYGGGLSLELFENIKNVDLANFGEVSQLEPSRNEVGNAIRMVGSIDSAPELALGSWYWDRLIFSQVPGQLVGDQFKSSLMFGVNLPIATDIGVTVVLGGTEFWNFGWLSPLFILAIFFLLFLLFRLGRRSMVFQIYYIYTLILVPMSVSHGSEIFITRLPELLIFTIILSPTLILWKR